MIESSNEIVIPSVQAPANPATKAQMNYLRRLGYRGPDPKTKDEASGLIDSIKDKKKIDSAAKRNEDGDGQRSYADQIAELRRMGYTGNIPISRQATEDLINDLKGAA